MPYEQLRGSSVKQVHCNMPHSIHTVCCWVPSRDRKEHASPLYGYCSELIVLIVCNTNHLGWGVHRQVVSAIGTCAERNVYGWLVVDRKPDHKRIHKKSRRVIACLFIAAKQCRTVLLAELCQPL